MTTRQTRSQDAANKEAEVPTEAPETPAPPTALQPEPEPPTPQAPPVPPEVINLEEVCWYTFWLMKGSLKPPPGTILSVLYLC